jgi:ATP-dependent DNA helicase RecG
MLSSLPKRSNPPVVPTVIELILTKGTYQKAILTLCLEPQSLLEIMGQLNYKHRTYLRSRHLIPLIEAGLLKLTNPAKPRSSRQKYLTTTKGKEYIEKIQDDDQVSD